MRNTLLIAIAGLLFMACEPPELYEFTFEGYVKNTTTNAPISGRDVKVTIVNSILGEENDERKLTTNDSGYFSFYYKDLHEHLIIKVEDDECSVTCENKVNSDEPMHYAYAIIDLKTISNNTDTHFVFDDSVKRVNFWIDQCNEIKFNFQDIQKDLNRNETWYFCDGKEDFYIDTNAMASKTVSFQVYSENPFIYSREVYDSNLTFIRRVRDTIQVKPGATYEYLIDQNYLLNN